MDPTEIFINACIDALKYGWTQPISLLTNQKFSTEQKESVVASLQSITHERPKS